MAVIPLLISLPSLQWTCEHNPEDDPGAKLNHDEYETVSLIIHAVIDECMYKLFPVFATGLCDPAEEALAHYII